MKKTLVALAVAGVMAAPMAAQAAATVYGKAHVSVDSYSSDITGTTLGAGTINMDTGLNVTSRASRLGVKGSEDLGGGLSAVYQMEFGVAMDGSGGVSGRNQIVGLSGAFGTVALGRHDTPYKMSTGKLDLFADTAADYNNIIGLPTLNATATKLGPNLDARPGNVIAYLSPNMNGLHVNVAGVTAENGNDTLGATSVAVTYDNGPLFVAVANENHKNAQNGTKFGLGYSMGAGKVGLVYEKGKQTDHNTDFKAWLVNGAYGMGNNTLIAEYGVLTLDAGGTTPDSGAKTTLFSVGVAHGFSKATSGYLAYGKHSMDTRSIGLGKLDTNIWTAGLVHSF